MEHAIVEGEYITFKHVKTRKVVILEVEVPEEHFQHVLNTLGMPIGGESKCVYVGLSAEQKQIGTNSAGTKEQTEGEKLRTRAVMLCGNRIFWKFACSSMDVDNESDARRFIVAQCGIRSRSELATNIDAQRRFKELDQEFKNWKFENQYSDNLERMP